MKNIQKNLEQLRMAITAAEVKYNRSPGSVTLVAVSKGQSIEKIKVAIAHGQTHFGESYLQEALIKIKEPQVQIITWHYIGRIQSRKTKLIAQNFAWVETVSSYEVAELLDKHRPTNLPPLNICIQINISKEASKAGVLLGEIMPLAQKITSLSNLKLRGLMSIPSYSHGFEQQIKPFKALHLEFKKLQNEGFDVDTLSMGMSDDFEAAIAAGATIVRIGTAVFGERVTRDYNFLF